MDDGPLGTNVSLQEKLDSFDKHSQAAFDELVEWLARDREALIAAARGRLVEGHYRYGDRLMYEYTPDELKAEASQEVADAINYLHVRVERRPTRLRGEPYGPHQPGTDTQGGPAA